VVPREFAQNPSTPCLTHPLGQGRILKQCEDRFGNYADVSRVHQDPRGAIDHCLRKASRPSRHYRLSAGTGLETNDAESFGAPTRFRLTADLNKHVTRTVKTRQALVRHLAQEDHISLDAYAAREPMEILAEAAVTGDEVPDIRILRLDERKSPDDRVMSLVQLIEARHAEECLGSRPEGWLAPVGLGCEAL
jgi:hypothetical protein